MTNNIQKMWYNLEVIWNTDVFETRDFVKMENGK